MKSNSATVLPRSIVPRFIANLVYRQNSRLSRFPPLKIPCYSDELGTGNTRHSRKSIVNNLLIFVTVHSDYL
jgi:hypothetical protein